MSFVLCLAFVLCYSLSPSVIFYLSLSFCHIYLSLFFSVIFLCFSLSLSLFFSLDTVVRFLSLSFSLFTFFLCLPLFPVSVVYLFVSYTLILSCSLLYQMLCILKFTFVELQKAFDNVLPKYYIITKITFSRSLIWSSCLYKYEHMYTCTPSSSVCWV